MARGNCKLHNFTKGETTMKRIISTVMIMAVMFISSLIDVRTASAEELKMTGTISKIELAADGKSATAVIKDSKTDAPVTITVTDDLTLDKFKDKRIVEGDEIRTKYEKEGDKNTSKMFKKTAGC
jgi:hypothetical protein